MTQDTLHTFLTKKIPVFMSDRQEKALLRLINRHVAEVIGEDEAYPESPMEEGEFNHLLQLAIHRNFLRAEQRNRAKRTTTMGETTD
jgi:hypothetical protein